MIIKVCGITNTQDALAAVAAGATAVGFILYSKSPRYVAPEQAQKIVAALPPKVLKVGVFVDELPRELERIMKAVGLDIAQLHGRETGSRVPKCVRTWKAFRVTPEWKPAAMDGFTSEAFVLDSPAHGQTFDWKLAAGLRQKIILAGGLHAGNVREAIRTVAPWGVDASSRLERRPGLKDHARVREFVRAALEAVQ
ncbi:MAG TPA: phosphoribosylanthranilate isomerase [Bryobacteraceae bacterium]|nr:phosphoribosylanthranilate isomerase [Bryobacteraceae bacterium]